MLPAYHAEPGSGDTPESTFFRSRSRRAAFPSCLRIHERLRGTEAQGSSRQVGTNCARINEADGVAPLHFGGEYAHTGKQP